MKKLLMLALAALLLAGCSSKECPECEVCEPCEPTAVPLEAPQKGPVQMGEWEA